MCALSKSVVLISSIVALAPAQVRAEVRPVVAVFDIEPSGLELPRAQTEHLSNYLADKIAEIAFFRVVPRSQLKERLVAQKAESYQPCYDDACQIELGKELAAEKILSTRVVRLGKVCKVSATVYDLARAATDISSVASGACDVQSLSRSIDHVTADLSKRRTLALTPEQRERYLQEARSSIPEVGRGHLSPYFFVLSDSPERDRLPLQETSVKVDVAGAIAEVNVSQHYKNEGEVPLEALYIFPASERAAISSMRMIIGERVIDAKIAQKGQARATYEEAREEGKTAALLEQVRPNVYQMNVAQILPGDLIKVELRYTELLVPQRGVYELVYPAHLGPRYASESSAVRAETYSTNPFLEVRQSGAPLALAVDIRGGMPVSRVESPSHRLDVRYRGPSEVHASFAKQSTDSDFILRWSLAGEQISTGLLLYPGSEENFFLMMMEPPQRTAADDIVPREYVFVVDVSGSMTGFPIDTSKNLMRDLLSRLRPHELFDIILFATASETLSDTLLPATRDNIQKGLELVEKQSGGGDTRLLPALERALALPRQSGASRTIVVLTDGIVEANSEVLALVRSRRGDANVFTFGIGQDVNRTLIEGLARAGMGEPFVVLDPQEAAPTAERFREYVSSPVLTSIRYQFEGFEAYDVEPPLLGDLFADRPLVAFGKYKGQPKGAMVIAGNGASAHFSQRLPITGAVSSEKNSALRDLWARHRIQRLTDLQLVSNAEVYRAEIEKLGLDYGLATQYTSFVAVDSESRSKPALATVAPIASKAQGEEIYATGSSIQSVDLSTPEPRLLDSHPLGAREGSEGNGFGFQLVLDPVVAQVSTDGRTIMSYGTIDVLAHFGEYQEYRIYGGLGFGYLAPRARVGLDVFASERIFVRFGSRASIARDTESRFLFTFSGELGLGLLLGRLGILASYLAGPGIPLGEAADGRGVQVFHGGSLSLSLDF